MIIEWYEIYDYFGLCVIKVRDNIGLLLVYIEFQQQQKIKNKGFCGLFEEGRDFDERKIV